MSAGLVARDKERGEGKMRRERMQWKKWSAVLLAALLGIRAGAPCEAMGAETQTAGQQEILSEEDPAAVSGGQTDGASFPLTLDDRNVYQGMEKAYQDGYTPAVEEGKAAIVLPLYDPEGSRVQSVTASPDLGDHENTPFVYRNYQKTFGKTTELINGTEEAREVFLVRFDLDLREDRENGVYPVTMDISCLLGQTELFREFTVYVEITDAVQITPSVTPTPGSSPEPTPSVLPDSGEKDPSPAEDPDLTDPDLADPGLADPELTDPGLSDPGLAGGGAVSVGGTQEEKPSPDPKVIVTACTGVPEHIYSGEDASFIVVLKNTNRKKYVQNMTVTVSCEAEGLSLLEDTNTFYFERLGTEESLELPLSFHVDEKTAAGKYTVLLNMSYDNPDASPLTSAGQIDLKVEQKDQVEMEVGEIPEEINAGDSMQIPVQVMNLGRGMVYNVRCSIQVPGLQSDKSLFLGNLDGGTAASGEFSVFAGIVNEDGETARERYGRTTGRLVLTYESENGEESQAYQDMAVTVNPLEVAAPASSSGEDESGQIRRQLVVGIGALILLSGAGITIPVLLRKRKRGERYE